MWRVLITEVKTGIIVDELEPIGAPTFDVEILTKGSWGVELILNNTTNANALAYAQSGKHTFVVCWDSYAVQGGLPTSVGFSQKDMKLSVQGSGLGAIFDDRICRTPSGPSSTLTASANNFTFTSYNKRRIVRELFASGSNETWSLLPLDLTDATGETGSENRSYTAVDFKSWWAQAMVEAESGGGPEFYFQPYITVSGGNRVVFFALKIGNPFLGNPALDAIWELNAAYGAIDLDYNTGLPRPFYTWAKGSGSGGESVVGWFDNNAAMNALGLPYKDMVDNGNSDIGDKTQLDQIAARVGGQASALQEQWSANARIDGKSESGVVISPTLGTWSVGDKPLFRITGHPVLSDGTYRRRIYGYTNSDPGTVALKIQPTPAGS